MGKHGKQTKLMGVSKKKSMERNEKINVGNRTKTGEKGFSEGEKTLGNKHNLTLGLEAKLLQVVSYWLSLIAILHSILCFGDPLSKVPGLIFPQTQCFYHLNQTI